MATMKLSPPWITLLSEVKALFKDDPEVEVVYDEANYVIRLMVTNQAKAEALDKIVRHEVAFGNVTARITVKYTEKNQSEFDAKIATFKTAFAGNPAFVNVIVGGNPVMGQVGYVMFKKEVVQFYNDNLADPEGNESTLYATIAKDVLDSHPGFYFSTDSEDLNG